MDQMEQFESEGYRFEVNPKFDAIFTEKISSRQGVAVGEAMIIGHISSEFFSVLMFMNYAGEIKTRDGQIVQKKEMTEPEWSKLLDDMDAHPENYTIKHPQVQYVFSELGFRMDERTVELLRIEERAVHYLSAMMQAYEEKVSPERLETLKSLKRSLQK